MKQKNKPFFSMDPKLVEMVAELNRRIEDCQSKNPGVDLHDIRTSCLMIRTYMIVIEKETRIIPKGHFGPTPAMVRYAIQQDKQ